MVFRWLFGTGGDNREAHEQPPKPEAVMQAPAGSFASLDPAMQEAIRMINTYAKTHRWTGHREAALDFFYRSLRHGDIEQAKADFRSRVLPLLPLELHERIKFAGPGGSWATYDELANARILLSMKKRPADCMVLGNIEEAGRRANVLFHGEGHLLTVATTESGKGQRLILPNLLLCPCPVVCLDPKGENYRNTAWRRDWFGPVFKWAPFEEDSDSFNPLDFVSDWDDARVLADLLIVPRENRESFWDTSARDLLTGMVFYVATELFGSERTMAEVRRRLAPTAVQLDEWCQHMEQSQFQKVRDLSHVIQGLRDNMLRDILATLRSHLDIWQSEAIAKVTSHTTRDWLASKFLTNTRIEEIQTDDVDSRRFQPRPNMRGDAASVFIIVPPENIRSYASVIRVMLGFHLQLAIRDAGEWERSVGPVNEEMRHIRRPYMFVFDELGLLGYMKIIEDAVPVARSYGIRLWLITQTLAQLEHVFPQWETMVGNCKTQIFFGMNEPGTAKYVADRLGERRDIWGARTPVATPAELMGPDFADQAVVFLKGQKPVRMHLEEPFYRDPEIQGGTQHQKAVLGDRPRRENPVWRRKRDEEEAEEVQRMERARLNNAAEQEAAKGVNAATAPKSEPAPEASPFPTTPKPEPRPESNFKKPPEF